MRTILCPILATAMLAAGVLAQLVPPAFNETSQTGPDKDGALRLHNYYRAQVGVPALTWCNNLSEEAQIAADWEAGADIPSTPLHNFTRRPSDNASYSLQIVYLSPSTPRVFGDFYQATLNFWAAHTYYHGEAIPNGDYFKYMPYSEYPPPQAQVPSAWETRGSYGRHWLTTETKIEAQMVWNGTTRVGMAGATDSENGTFIVAAYSPPGNVYKEKPYDNNTTSNSTSADI